MKKTLQILSVAIFAILSSINYSSAQSLELISFDTTVKGKPDSIYKSHAAVKNISGMEKKVFVRVTPIKLTPGHTFFVCTPVKCFNEVAETFATPAFKIIKDSIVDEGFYVAINPIDPVFNTETEGETTLKIDFIISDNETDFVTYNTTFSMSKASVIETWNRTANVFPNPSTDHIAIRLKEEYSNSSIINVYDANGNKQHTSEILPSNNNVNISTSSWNAGTYYFTIESNGSIINSGNFTVVR